MEQLLKQSIMKGFMSDKWSDKNIYNILKYDKKLRTKLVSDIFYSINSKHEKDWIYIGKGSYGVVLEYRPLKLAVKVITGFREVRSEIKGYRTVYESVTENCDRSIRSSGFCTPIMYIRSEIDKKTRVVTCIDSNELKRDKDTINTALIFFPLFPSQSLYSQIHDISLTDLVTCCSEIAKSCMEMINNDVRHHDLYATNVLFSRKHRRTEMIDFGMARNEKYNSITCCYNDLLPFILNLLDTMWRKRHHVTREFKSIVKRLLSCMSDNKLFNMSTISIFDIPPERREYNTQFDSYINTYFDCSNWSIDNEDCQYAVYFKYIKPLHSIQLIDIKEFTNRIQLI
jgi:serine/threonine protein kinase